MSSLSRINNEGRANLFVLSCGYNSTKTGFDTLSVPLEGEFLSLYFIALVTDVLVASRISLIAYLRPCISPLRGHVVGRHNVLGLDSGNFTSDY